MRVLFCGGGTAGHISPAIAMAQMLSESKYECECAFVGRSGGEENLAITSEGYKLYTIEIEGIRRRVSGQTIRSVLKVIKSLRAAREILDEYKPELIIGTGGYVCWPIIKAGISKKIKTVIHESNAEPGLVTRTLGPKCDAVLLNLDAAKNRLRGCRCVRVIGNPMRRGFESGSKEDCRRALSIARGDILIVSFGGSLGAKRLNDVVCEVMKNYSLRNSRVRHIHATGRRYYPEYQERYPELCRGIGKCKIVPYIENMPMLMKAADIALTRCGAITLSELGCAEVCGVLIPSPNVSGNHQYKNAEYLAKNGAGVMIEEKDLDAEMLVDTLDELVRNEAKRQKYAKKISELCAGNVKSKFLDFIEEITYK